LRRGEERKSIKGAKAGRGKGWNTLPKPLFRITSRLHSRQLHRTPVAAATWKSFLGRETFGQPEQKIDKCLSGTRNLSALAFSIADAGRLSRAGCPSPGMGQIETPVKNPAIERARLRIDGSGLEKSLSYAGGFH
jgi:hypothetical protein